MFQGGLLTPKDYSSYFKNVLHRALLTRNRKPADDGSKACRCCLAADESLSHLPDCPSLLPDWLRLLKLIDEPHSSKAVLLGVGTDDQALPLGWRALWLLVWKFTIISFTQIGLGEACRLDPSTVWEQALRRLVVRIHAKAHDFRLRLVRAHGRGFRAPSPASANRIMEPLASLDEQGALTWLPALAEQLQKLGIGSSARARTNKKPTQKAAPTQSPIKFVAESNPHPESTEPDHSQTPPAVSSEDRFAWAVTRRISVERIGNRVTLYSAFSGMELRLVPTQQYLPMHDLLSNPNRADTIEGLCKAVRKATRTPLDLQSRQQLLVFGAEHGQEAAEDYIDRLWQGGLGAREPITEVMLPCTNARITHLVTKALSRCNAITNDVYKLRGPVRAMQQAMQPAVQTASPTPTEEEAEEDRYDEATRIMREMEQDPPADF